MTIRVVLAEDQDLVRAGLRMILEAEDDISVVGEARDGREALRLSRELSPDVCLFDIRMPGLDGIEVTRRLHDGASAAAKLPAVVVVTTFDLDEYVFAALDAGARGFLLKDAGAAMLVQAVRAAAVGDALIAPNITARLLARFAKLRPREVARPTDPLTEREEEILAAVARGSTNQEIADGFHISASTVKTHIASLMSKLSARNRVELARWAYETGRVPSVTR